MVLVLVLGAGLTLRAQRLPIRPYTTADGLAHNNVNRIVRDSRGFLWFCTAGGLSRFDGYAFTNFGTGQGLPHANVTDLLETRAGDYWVAFYRGGKVVQLSPRGEIVREHALDAMCPTMPAFGGADRRTLYVTSARQEREPDELARLPRSGGLFAMRAAVAGLPEPCFAG